MQCSFVNFIHTSWIPRVIFNGICIHNTVVHSQYSGTLTIQWYTCNTIVRSQYNSTLTVQWYTHYTAVCSKYSGALTIQWYTHNTIVRSQL